MPATWSQRDERQYGHILKSCRRTDRRRSVKTCKRIAAATVNKQRSREGRTLSGLVPALYGRAHRERVAALRRAGCKVTLVQRPEGTLVLKRCPPGARVSALDGCGCDSPLQGFAVRSTNDPETGGWAPGWARGKGG